MHELVRLHPGAWREFRRALRWYEAEQHGLGGQLWDEVNDVLDRVADRTLPGMNVQVELPDRTLEKVFVERFHYTIYYEWWEGLCYVWAIAHQRRRPGYWVRRAREGFRGV